MLHGNRLTWDVFKAEFCREYLTNAFKVERQNEFVTLKQGSMTMREHVDRFEDLYKYASDIFPTETQKCYRFKEGLQIVLKNELSLYEGQHFRGWVEKAIEKEKLREEIEQESKLKASVWIRKQKGFNTGASTSQQRSEIGGPRGSIGPWTWHIRRDCPNWAQFGTSAGRGVQSRTSRGGRTFGFGIGMGRGLGAGVSREGGASTLTHLTRPVYTERPLVQPRVQLIHLLHHHSHHVSKERSVMDDGLVVDMPVGESMVFDVIIGMDVLTKYQAMIDCYKKKVEFQMPTSGKIVFRGERGLEHYSMVSALTARRMMRKGCEAFLAYVIDTKKEAQKLDSIPVVNKFTNVFPEDLQGLAPDREIKFSVDL
ncbi:uncharacterized protein LOC112536061 [Ricinus communis]|uniref:uncharacterized protein LOC112536061 n=1 Tax=Ricinus communis TaxID=3988 RepID=UPI000D692F33|nr:uncharacterized protein LOC112536061 [Ricinus communis]|eukprot:XP_025014399.1 uncharacterized protein LOC112536061 [Ricinus communis]